MNTIFDTMGIVMESVFGSLFNFVTLIITNPYLLIGVSLILIGAAVSFLKRLIRV